MPYRFGSRKYSQGVYGGGDSPAILSSIPAIVEVYDNTGMLKGTYQTGAGYFLGCEFTLDESGCRDFTLYFAQSVDIEKRDIIKIKIFNSDDYFFTGVVRVIPIDGSTETKYNYRGFGLNDYLLRINAESQSYANKTIEFILNDLLDDIIILKSPINKNLGKIDVPNITLTSFEINYNQMPNVLDALKKIANSEGDYIIGVDRVGDFFFKPRDAETKVTLVVGKKGIYGIDRYEPEDEYEAKTKLFLLDKDGVFISSFSSGEDNDIYEKKVTAPDVDNTSAEKWAEGILAESEINTRRASIEWKIEEQNPLLLIADGSIRIICNIPSPTTTQPSPNPYGSGTYGSGLYGGGLYQGKDIDDLLIVKEVRYILTSSQSVRQIQLGSLPVRLDEQIKELRKNLLDLEISLGR